jgi:hypothetical protein
MTNVTTTAHQQPWGLACAAVLSWHLSCPLLCLCHCRAGAGLYTNSQVKAVMQELTSSAFGNPHSRGSRDDGSGTSQTCLQTHLGLPQRPVVKQM